ncbi:MAG: hypothetical protein EOP50_20240, partial [Sphingobacteriales bacterium]
MTWRLVCSGVGALTASVAIPAMACSSAGDPFRLEYGTRAEVIVVGRITDYEKVQKRCGLPGEIIPLCGYARIFVTVEKVLAGQSDKMISAIVDKHAAGGLTSDGLTGMSLPLPTNPVLIALEDLSAVMSKHGRTRRNSDGSVTPYARWGILTVVEQPCRSAFVFDAESN